MTTPRAVLDHILTSISPASAAQAEGARQRVGERLAGSATAAGTSLGAIERLAERLAGARHSPRPRVTAKAVVIVAADHGVAYSGVDLGPDNPTIVAVRHIAGGNAAINSVARAASATVVIADCGVRGAAEMDLGAGVLRFRIGDGTADMTETAAMTPVDAVMAVQTGIALLFSMADEGLDVVALGHVSVGSEPSSGAVVAALADIAPSEIGPADAEVIERALALHRPSRQAPLHVLAAVGGYELGVLSGVILGAASIHVPIILDDHATSAAALIATALCPAVSGYLVAAHAGASPVHRAALNALAAEPLFDLGLSHGEGTGAALSFPFVDAAAELLRDTGSN